MDTDPDQSTDSLAVRVKDTLRGLAPLYHSAYAVGIYAFLRALAQEVDCGVVLTTIDRAMARTGPWVVGAVTALVRPGQLGERLSYGGHGPPSFGNLGSG